MALRKEIEDPFEEARAKQEQVALKKKVIKKYGERLGGAYIAYINEDLSEQSDQKQNRVRTAFSEAIVSTVLNGTYEERVNALNLLLEAFETKIRPVAEMAEEARNSSSVY